MSRFSFSLPSVQVLEVDNSKLYLSTMSYQKKIIGSWFLVLVSASDRETAPAVISAKLQEQARKERVVSTSL